MKIENVEKLDLPKILDERGNLTFIQNNTHVPFDIQRVYWIYDVPGGEVRGGHAYKTQWELIVALSGSFDVVVNDGIEEKVFTLNRSYNGIVVPNLIWRQLKNFSTNSLALILTDQDYNEDDYIRDFNKYTSTNEG